MSLERTVGSSGGLGASLYDANTILKADTDNTPVALTMGASTVLARLAAGDIVAATVAQIRTLLGTQVLIANTVLGADTASFDFTTIPATYTHLRLVMMLRGTQVATTTSALLRFNNDSGTNYDRQIVSGSAGTPASSEGFGATSHTIGAPAAASAGASLFTSIIVDVPYYAATSFNKVFHARQDRKIGTSTTNLTIIEASGFWRSSAAIDRITILPGANNWLAASACSLYGIP